MDQIISIMARDFAYYLDTEDYGSLVLVCKSFKKSLEKSFVFKFDILDKSVFRSIKIRGDKVLCLETDPRILIRIINIFGYNHRDDDQLYVTGDFGNEDRTPLIQAAKLGNIELVKMYIERGADPLYGSCQNMNALQWAIHKRKYKMVVYLLNNGSSISGYMFDTLEDLVDGTEKSFNIMKAIIDKGCQINDVDDDGCGLGTYCGLDPHVLEYLLSRGLNIHRVNSDGKNIVDVFLDKFEKIYVFEDVEKFSKNADILLKHFPGNDRLIESRTRLQNILHEGEDLFWDNMEVINGNVNEN